MCIYGTVYFVLKIMLVDFFSQNDCIIVPFLYTRIFLYLFTLIILLKGQLDPKSKVYFPSYLQRCLFFWVVCGEHN